MLRNPYELMRPHAAKLREPTMTGLAQQSAFYTISRIRQYSVAGRPAFNPRADFSDIARTIEPQDRRQSNLDPRHSAASEDIVIVEGCSAHPNQHIAFSGYRIGEVGFQGWSRRPALFPQYHCPHRSALIVYPQRRFSLRLASSALLCQFYWSRRAEVPLGTRSAVGADRRERWPAHNP